MKVQDSKRYSSCTIKVTISHRLLSCINFMPLVNCYLFILFTYGINNANCEWNGLWNNQVTTATTVVNGWPTVDCTDCEFSCHSKRLCINPDLVCDGINDCDDGSDELSCYDESSICLKDECYSDKRQYANRCGCVRTSFNDKMCVKEKRPFLVLSTLNHLYKADLGENRSNEQVNKALDATLNPISAFEYRTFDDLLIWLNPIENKIFMGKVNLEQKSTNGTTIYGTEAIVTEPHKIYGFVFDWMSYTLFWIDDYGIKSDYIDLGLFIRLNQTQIHRNLNPSHDKPGSMAYDAKERLIFWVNRGADPMRPYAFPVYIERIDVHAESKVKRIVNKNILSPVGLMIDTDKYIVYWIDGLYRTLNSVNYDGTNRIVLYESMPFINEVISMDIYSDYLYFMEKANSSIQRIDLLARKDALVEEWITVSDWPILFVKIVDPVKQQNETHPENRKYCIDEFDLNCFDHTNVNTRAISRISTLSDYPMYYFDEDN